MTAAAPEAFDIESSEGVEAWMGSIHWMPLAPSISLPGHGARPLSSMRAARATKDERSYARKARRKDRQTMGTTRTPRRRRERGSRTVVRLPEQALAERVLDLAAPLLDRLGVAPPPAHARAAVVLAITFWNAMVNASQFWGQPRPKELNDLRRRMCGKSAAPGDPEAFELLTARWHDQQLDFDPRFVDDWTFEVEADGQPRLFCEMALPDGVEVDIPPPIEKRVAIGARFLDEECIPLTATSLLRFPVQHHSGAVGTDGRVTIHTKMPTAVALFANGAIRPIGGEAVELMVEGKKLGAMVLTGVQCGENGGRQDVAVLVFEPATVDATAAR